MKKFVFLALSIPLLSGAIIAQTPDPSISPTASATGNQASPSPPQTLGLDRQDRWRLHQTVELMAVGIMLSSVFVVFYLVLRHQDQRGMTIGPRHIQFVSVCLIVPTILILGLEQV